MERTYCVYKHTNKINGKIYIGITSQRPRKRWDCGRGYMNNEHFWRAIQKYGWDNFEHEILFDGLSPEDAFEKEQELILKYDSRNYQKGYNNSAGGEGGATGICGENHPMYGKHHSVETREKLRESHKGVPYSPERYEKFIENLDRDSLRERAYRTIAGYNKGCKWDDESNRKRSESNKGKKRSKETKDKIGESHKKSIVQLSLDGKWIKEWDSIKSASEQLGITGSNISEVCRHLRKTAGGFIWLYAHEWR